MTDVWTTPVPTRTPTRGWRGLAAGGAAGPMCSVAVAVLANGMPALPYALVVTALFAATASWTARGRGRGGPVALAVLTAAGLAFEGSFGMAATLVRPASWPTFLGDAFWLTGTLVILVALVLRGRLRRPLAVAGVGVLAMAAAVVLSLAAIALAADPRPHAGDIGIQMAATDRAFSCDVPAQLPVGVAAVFVRNDDTVPHQFILDRTAVDVRAGGTARTTVHLPAGTASWRCVYFGHHDLTGTAHTG